MQCILGIAEWNGACENFKDNMVQEVLISVACIERRCVPPHSAMPSVNRQVLICLDSCGPIPQVRQRNVLMDFVQVAGPLGVSHFMILSRTKSHVNLRLCRLPRGPTITFHIDNVCMEGIVHSHWSCGVLGFLPVLPDTRCHLQPQETCYLPHSVHDCTTGE